MKTFSGSLQLPLPKHGTHNKVQELDINNNYKNSSVLAAVSDIFLYADPDQIQTSS